jgi:hypothetical protein
LFFMPGAIGRRSLHSTTGPRRGAFRRMEKY